MTFCSAPMKRMNGRHEGSIAFPDVVSWKVFPLKQCDLKTLYMDGL
jgi:hypothetical protein